MFFLIFGMKVQNGNAQNVTEPDFRKKKFWANLGPKVPKNRVFWTFFKICSLVFPDFLYEDEELIVKKKFFEKKFFWANFGPKMPINMVFWTL